MRKFSFSNGFSRIQLHQTPCEYSWFANVSRQFTFWKRRIKSNWWLHWIKSNAQLLRMTPDPNSNTHNYYSFTPINSVVAYVVVWQIVIVFVVVVVFDNVVIVRCALALIRLHWIYLHIPSSPNDDVIFCAIEYMDFCLSISFHRSIRSILHST